MNERTARTGPISGLILASPKISSSLLRSISLLALSVASSPSPRSRSSRLIAPSPSSASSPNSTSPSPASPPHSLPARESEETLIAAGSRILPASPVIAGVTAPDPGAEPGGASLLSFLSKELWGIQNPGLRLLRRRREPEEEGGRAGRSKKLLKGGRVVSGEERELLDSLGVEVCVWFWGWGGAGEGKGIDEGGRTAEGGTGLEAGAGGGARGDAPKLAGRLDGPATGERERIVLLGDNDPARPRAGSGVSGRRSGGVGLGSRAAGGGEGENGKGGVLGILRCLSREED
ncbi:hypothetical protein CALVIDRAFT_134145 [Calocera viscosa TUFC12733]|uniref:Uncharacterized protein n=1 Tax=Calocera viscosa (strain TUFC12733) TaxID=1330018 RepID=A0A167LWZ2_CALVF|nr:hypothetical protein CALVIDRAFT_134145 [Calocera viscosa TUFC12733]